MCITVVVIDVVSFIKLKRLVSAKILKFKRKLNTKTKINECIWNWKFMVNRKNVNLYTQTIIIPTFKCRNLFSVKILLEVFFGRLLNLSSDILYAKVTIHFPSAIRSESVVLLKLYSFNFSD